jgi:hypothetical protein
MRNQPVSFIFGAALLTAGQTLACEMHYVIGLGSNFVIIDNRHNIRYTGDPWELGDQVLVCDTTAINLSLKARYRPPRAQMLEQRL